MTRMEPLRVESAPLSGITLIEASAGTGKTHTIATLFLRLLLETELSLSQILVVTFTRAATAELRLRIRKRLSQALEAFEADAEHAAAPVNDPVLARMAHVARERAQTAACRKRLVDALRSFDEAAIFTIHGFCQRVLKRHAFESGMPFETELLEDQSLSIEEVVSDFWAQRLACATPAFVTALADAKVSVASLMTLVKRVASNPELVVLPEVQTQPTQQLECDYAASGAEVAKLWQQHGPEIEALLARRGLNQSFYGPGKLRAVFSTVLPRAAKLPLHQLDPKLKHLTTSGIKTNKDFAPPRHVFFDACEAWWLAGCALRSALRFHVIEFQHDLLAYARQELERRGDESSSLGFDDLLSRLAKNLRSSDGEQLIRSIRNTHCAALIDEFQDTDPVQCDVFRRIYGTPLDGVPEGSLFLIGDPKQAIYAFRGADIYAYMAAAKSGVDRAYTLTTNYRSDPGVLRAIDSLFSRARLPFLFPEIRYHGLSPAPAARDQLAGAGAAFEILVLEPANEAEAAHKRVEVEQQITRQLASEIIQLLNSGARLDGAEVEPRHIAVLCRTNLQAQGIQATLRELGIPAVLDGDASVFESNMAEELGRWLWAIVEPSDPARLRAALATTGLGFIADDLLSLERDERAWDRHVTDFHAWHDLWHAHGFMRAFYTLCEEREVPARLMSLPDGERRYTDLMHLAELLHAQALQTRCGPRALLDWYRRMRAGAGKRWGMAQSDMQIRLESDARAVTLTTIHKSKGLQFPIVYCPFLCMGSSLRPAERDNPQFHDPDHADRPTLVLNSDDDAHGALAERESLAENLRLLYVALTRAKHRMSIVWTRAAQLDKSALAYLLHQGASSQRPGPAPRTPELEALAADALKLLRTPSESDLLRVSTPKRVKSASDAELQADLAQLSAAAQGAIEVRPLSRIIVEQPYREARASSRQLAARIATARPADRLQISSFSQLAASDRSRSPDWEPVAWDRDEASEPFRAEPVPSAHAPRVPLADFPAGASFGHLVHTIYEQVDFRVASAQAMYPTVQAALNDYGSPASWCEPLAAALFASLHAPLSAAGTGLPTLASVAWERRLSELEFVFPVTSGVRVEQANLLSPQRLSQVLTAHARDADERAYASRIRALRFVPFAGFLRGFVDLVVEHAGRFYILDYKSNHLGAVAADYERAQLGPQMHRHHYVLQYLVYSLALHRHLERRLPGYRYADHFGGVYYLFVRGMHPEHAPGSGVFFDRPEHALIEALSSLVAAGSAAS